MIYTIDAKGKTLGRLATEIALLLQGKNTAKYERQNQGSDKVVVQNAAQIKVTGKKFEEKVYYRHTGYMGHLKEKTYRQAYEKDPTWVLRHAVYGMLPKNFLQDRRIKRLVIEK